VPVRQVTSASRIVCDREKLALSRVAKCVRERMGTLTGLTCRAILFSSRSPSDRLRWILRDSSAVLYFEILPGD